MKLRDTAFQTAFSKMFVYNILFEDAEVDERFLGVGEDSSVLSITGAGCGVAGMVSRQPRSIDAVDINPHHLALTALKATTAQHLFPYSVFYDLFGRGWRPDPRETIGLVSDHLPSWMRSYWAKPRHYGRFNRNFYNEGLTAFMVGSLRRMSGVDANWLRALMHQPVEARLRAVEEWIAPTLRRPAIKALMESPLQLLSLGINFNQRDRLLDTEGTDLINYFVTHMKRVAETELETNWFAWFVLAGQYNHDHPDAVPPYLRRDRWENSQKAPTRLNFHNRNIFDVLGEGQRNQWSHFTFCDAPDWMPEPVQQKLLDEVLRTGRDGGIMLYRTVEDDCIVDRLGMHRHLRRLEPESEEASRLDRSRQYRHVHFYQIQH
jgi:S-adenosylmethionine-diacylglycerol 3-amino-3-carboxypropyl transferase